jgi:hypothetical protein
MTHYKIPVKVSGYVAKSVTQNDGVHWDNGCYAAEILWVDLYVGSVPTFTVKIIEEGDAYGCIFAYIPPHGFKTIKNKKISLLEDLVYHNCPNEIAWIGDLCMDRAHVLVFDKDYKPWINGEYLFTIDWCESNVLLNVVELENGFIAFQPFHKLKFGNSKKITEKLPDFKKMKQMWHV